ncbi:MAG: hypothetical protein ACLPSH_02055 [Vulcanimicrobiaceae bacterium]
MLGVVLTDPQALEELRDAPIDDVERLRLVLLKVAGIDVSPEEARDVVDKTNEFVGDLGERVKGCVVHHFMIVNGPHGP